MRGLLLFAAFLSLEAQLHAQTLSPELRDLIEQRIESTAEELGDNSDVDLSGIVEQLMDHLHDPIDLNHTNAEELSSLNLLSDLQVIAILDHIKRFGKFISIYELQTVDGMDNATLEVLQPFVTIHGADRTRTPLKEMLANGTSEVIVRMVADVQQRKGFLGQQNIFGTLYTDPDGGTLPNTNDPQVLDSLRQNSKVYLGSPWKVYTRYRFRYRQNIDFGVTGEKDAGEQFFKGTEPQGFDFYSAHLFLRNVGPLKALALGDFQARFGQGLVFSSGLSYARKSAYTMNIKGTADGLTPYTSVNENQFLRGAGATMDLGKHFEGTAFVSRMLLDASVQASDTANGADASEAIFSSFQQDGYHRTYAELSKKNAIDALIYGGNMRYKGAGFTLGATAAQEYFGASLARSYTYPYNQFEFQGIQNSTYGFDWNMLHRNFSWFGEGARSSNGGLAGVTGILVALDKRLSLAMLYRDLGRDFRGIYSAAFQEGSNPWNERGLYTGIELKANRAWTLNAYFDQFSFPWLRYQVNAPSDGYEVLGQVTWTPSKTVQLYAKARRQVKSINSTEDLIGVAPLVDVDQVNYRFNASYRVSNGVTMRTRVEMVKYQRGDAPYENGFLIHEDIIHRPLHGRVEFTGRVSVYSTDTYNARIYVFESDLPGVYSLPPIYGTGMLWYAMLRYSPARHLDLWVRYGSAVFDGQNNISSGLQEISGDRDNDLKLAARYIF